MKLEVITPEQYYGAVQGDLNRKRAIIEHTEHQSRAHVIHAKVPLSEMFGYASDLRSATQGRASYSMQFDSYAQVPTNVATEIIAKAKGE